MTVSDWLLLVVVVFVGIPLAVVAVRFGVTLNFNKWQERRDRLRTQKLRALCPHVEVREAPDGKLGFASLIFSPVGTWSWTCRRCGIVTQDPDVAQELIADAAKNPSAWMEREAISEVREKVHEDVIPERQRRRPGPCSRRGWPQRVELGRSQPEAQQALRLPQTTGLSTRSPGDGSEVLILRPGRGVRTGAAFDFHTPTIA